MRTIAGYSAAIAIVFGVLFHAAGLEGVAEQFGIAAFLLLIIAASLRQRA